MQKANNLQEIFLTQVRRERRQVTVFLMNGFQMRGYVSGFDAFTLVLMTDGKQQVIYKHAISTIVPERPVSMEREEELRLALKIACADSFVDALPQGIDTVLGEHGSGLSEGQIQRIAVARAVFSRRPILLLDEATSALDEATEEKLLDNLKTMTDKTVLIVTHRPRACEVCDRVIYMEAPEQKEVSHDG
jgi:RNA chaperone Hfq